MSDTFDRIQQLINEQQLRISVHGYDELASDNLWISSIIGGASKAVIVEDYPNYYKGPCVLVLQRDQNDQPVHVLWGIPKNADFPAVLITAYRPDPTRWSDDYLRRTK